jgi:hypothetical protein
MEIKEKQIRVISEDIIKQVLCNGCEKDIWNGHTIDGARMSFNFEYGSKYDGDFQFAELCDDCFEKIRYGLKIPLTGM